MPGWHARTEEAQRAGDLQVVGILQEQHPDRARLFMQWKEMTWPLLVDSLDLLGVEVVPLTLLVDEAGVVRSVRPSFDDLDTFLATQTEAVPPPPSRPERPGLETLRGEALADALVLWHPDRLGEAIELYRHALGLVGSAPVWQAEDATTLFHLGVAHRRRYDSEDREAGDFGAAVAAWTRALELEPNQYIWRRRIQQYGARLEKPYPFYDWVEEARRTVAGRGEVPVTLEVEPQGAELATPQRSFSAAAEDVFGLREPDPQGRIRRDRRPFVHGEATAVPWRLRPGQAARVHLEMQPNDTIRAHWNNEAEALAVWVSPPDGWRVDRPLHTVELPRAAASNEVRRVEFELSPPEGFLGTAEVSAYALYYVCEDVDGTCLYRRQDFSLPITVHHP